MKKIFTLIAAAVVSLGVNAIDYKVSKQVFSSEMKLVDNALTTITTANQETVNPVEIVDGPDQTSAPITYAGETFSHYLGLRVTDAPSTTNPTGTVYESCIALQIVAKQNVDVTLYYKIGSTKELSCYDQTAQAAVAVEQTATNPGEDYLLCTGLYKLQEGHTYTVYAKGGTVQFHGLNTATGTYVAPSNTFYANVSASTVDGFSTMVYGDGAKVALVGNAAKSYSSASSITIDGKKYTSTKVSNGAQNKFIAPEGKYVTSVTIYSYVNKDAATERDCFWKEVNGVTYSLDGAEGTVQTTIMQCYKGSTPDAYTYNLGGVPEFTFTNTGEQACFVLDVTYGAPSGIANVTTNASASAKTVKIIENGQFVIKTANGTFTAAGARIK